MVIKPPDFFTRRTGRNYFLPLTNSLPYGKVIVDFAWELAQQGMNRENFTKEWVEYVDTSQNMFG
jgi:hypothetical protein